MFKKFVSSLLAAGTLFGLIAIPAAQAQALEKNFPTQPVRIIVPYGAGGAADLLARLVGEKLSEYWGQAVIVENRPGGVGTIGISAVVKSKPDGYTLVTVPVSDLAVNPHLYKNRPFDVLKDLAPVSQLGAVPNILVVPKTSGIKTARELIEYSKKQDGVLSYSSPGVGSQAHIAAEVFIKTNGIKMQHIPYNSVSAALTDLVGGHIDSMFAQFPAAWPLIKANKVVALGIAAEERSVLIPDLPTLQEATGRSYGDAISWSGLMAPAGTPLPIREKIARDIKHLMQSTDLSEKLAQQGTVGIGSTPQELAAAIDRDYKRYGKAIEEMNISIN